MLSQRWMAVTEPQFPWERAALDYLHERLPDQDPFRAWSNFEFIAEDGSINAVDLLVVSLYKIYLIEIKSRPGRVSGDVGTWTWTHDGRHSTEDNPLLLANRKAKKLKSLLLHQNALRHTRTPFIEPMIFLSAPGFRSELSGAARTGVYLRHDMEQVGHPDITAVLRGATEATGRGNALPPQSVDRRLSQAIARALDQAGIRPSQRGRRVGDYQLEQLLGETDAYQEWQASHSRFLRVKRRVRLYPHALHASAAITSISACAWHWFGRSLKPSNMPMNTGSITRPSAPKRFWSLPRRASNRGSRSSTGKARGARAHPQAAAARPSAGVCT
jgi:Nuclease-related domain